MTIYYSDYSDAVEGRSLVDLSTLDLMTIKSNSSDYLSTTAYQNGDTVVDQGAVWVYINTTSGTNHAPPTLPTVSNSYWELLGIVATNSFTWIAYSTSPDGIQNFTTDSIDAGGINRTYIGTAFNKPTMAESSNPVDYEWSKFVGEDGEMYLLSIESTNGTVFREGLNQQTILIARLFKNGVDITDSIPSSQFAWRRVSMNPQPYPNDDTTWNSTYQSGYKQITISVDDVDAKATFFCDITTL